MSEEPIIVIPNDGKPLLALDALRRYLKFLNERVPHILNTITTELKEEKYPRKEANKLLEQLKKMQREYVIHKIKVSKLMSDYEGTKLNRIDTIETEQIGYIRYKNPKPEFEEFRRAKQAKIAEAKANNQPETIEPDLIERE